MTGEQIAHFKILEKLGAGGMGVVYKATDTQLMTTVALKFLPPELTRDDVARERLLREARALAGLDHPNICTVHSIHDAPDGRIFFCMNYYDGETLQKRLAREPMSLTEALRTARSIARGLAHAHKSGIIHRDIKPGNIIITTEGTVKILDFGLARLVDRSRVTQQGMTPGTVHYMSPEQLSTGEVDARSDVFSLGVVLYEMLTGHLPFEADHRDAVAYRVLNQTADRLSLYRKDMPNGLQQVLNSALAKNPADRYSTVTEFQRDIERALGYGFPHHRLRATVIAVAAAGVIAAGIWAWQTFIPSRLPTKQRLMVLPFANVSADPYYRTILEGLNDALNEQLLLVDDSYASLWVLPSEEAARWNPTRASETSDLFGVNLLLSGGLEQTEDELQLTLSLFEAGDENPQQTATVVSGADGLARWQTGLATEVLEMLGRSLDDRTLAVLSAGTTSRSDAYAAYLEGRGLARRPDRLEQAIERFETALARDPDYALAHVGLAHACTERFAATQDTTYITRALEHCRAALAYDSTLAVACITRGAALRTMGRHNDAIDAYRHAMDVGPSSVASLGLSAALASTGNTDEAEATLKRVIRENPDYWPAHFELGLLYYPLGNYKLAAAELEKVVAATPGYNMAYNTLGSFYYLMGENDKAAELWQKSFGIEKSYGACSNLGTLYYREGRYEDAARMYEWAIEFDDPTAGYLVWGNLAQAYARLPDAEGKARANYEKAIAIAEAERDQNPTDPFPPAYLAGYYADIGDTARSHECIDEAVKVAPQNGEILFRAGHAYAKLGDNGRALVWIARALENGYSKAEVLEDPELADLRQDPRFDHLMGNGD